MTHRLQDNKQAAARTVERRPVPRFRRAGQQRSRPCRPPPAIRPWRARCAPRKLAASPTGAEAGEVRVVERLPTIPEPGVRYVVATRQQRRYDFEVTIHGESRMQLRYLTPEQAVDRLRAVWRLCHDDLDTGRAENERLVKRREDHWVAGFWSDTFGGVEVPDPDMWNEVGRGPLAAVMQVLNSTEAALKQTWARSAGEHRPEPRSRAREQPVHAGGAGLRRHRGAHQGATALLEKAAAELRERQRRLDEYVEGSIRGAQRAITGIKVTIVVLEAGAGGRARASRRAAACSRRQRPAPGPWECWAARRSSSPRSARCASASARSSTSARSPSAARRTSSPGSSAASSAASSRRC